MGTNAKKPSKADQRRQQQRDNLFKDVSKDEVWSPDSQGWCLVPRTMPLILQQIRGMSKGSSAAETYFALWCNSMSHSIVEMTNRAGLIAAAGYAGPSSERTWKERMRKLEELGFIKIKSGKHGDISCVLIVSPHKVLQRHANAKTPGFDQNVYNTILECAIDYSMRDFKEDPVVQASTGSIVPLRPSTDGIPNVAGESIASGLATLLKGA